MRESKKEIVVNFEVTIKEDDGKFIGECKDLPGLIVSGTSKGDVLKNIKEAMPLYIKYVPKESFIPVYEDPINNIIFDFEEFNGFLYAATNKDVVIKTKTGDISSWEQITVANIFSSNFNPPVSSTKAPESDMMTLGDYTPQVYCLKAFNDLGTPKLFAGTNANGGIYETQDGKNWALAFNSGEARIHCIEAFHGRLFAGTSNEGKIYTYNGTHWVISLTTPEMAITSLRVYKDYLYAGTYQNGLIYRTADGVNWQKIFDTNQTFVNDFYMFKNRFYASTAKSTGGLIYATDDGINWVENFFSEKDVNFFKFTSFGNILYCGSGNAGKIYKTADGKKWEVAFQTDEEDVRTLFVFNGYLYFGSSPKGRIFKTTMSNTPPPKTHNVQVNEVSSHSVQVSWETDKEANTMLEYGTDISYGSKIISEKPDIKHRLTITNLKALTTYHFRLLTYSGLGSFNGALEDYTFTTTAAVTPVITSKTHPDQEKWYNVNEAELFWGVHPDVNNYLYMLDDNPYTMPKVERCHKTVKEGMTIKNIEDGVSYFHLLIEDKAGNISTTVSHFTLRIDTIVLPPAVTSLTHPDHDKWYNINTPVFQWTAPEDLSGIEGYYYIIDDLPNTAPTEKTGLYSTDTTVKLQAVEDGVKYFHIVAKDKAGNTGTKTTHYRLNIDNEALAPVLTSRTHPDRTSWYKSTTIEMHIAKPQDLSGIDGFYYCFDNKPETEPRQPDWTYTSSTDISLMGKGDGTWYAHVKTKDLAGNISRETAHFKFNIDTVALPPNISSISHPDSQKWYNIKKGQFKLGPADDLSGVEGYFYIIDNEPRTVPDATSTFTEKETIVSPDLADGVWYMHVISKDKAGNVGTLASHFRFSIDTAAKPPFVHSKTHPDQEAWYSNPLPQISWDTPDDLSGIEGYYYVFDNKTNTVPNKDTAAFTNSNQAVLPQLVDGTWYFHIISKDNAGNIGYEAAHYKFKIDTHVEAPRIISNTHPDENKWYNSQVIKLSWAVPQDLSKIKGFFYLISKEKHLKIPHEMAVSTDKREIEYKVEEEGTYFFHLVAEDNAGNTGEEPAIFRINVDLKANPPDVISSTHQNPDKYYSNTHPIFIVERVDDLSGVDGFYYIVDRDPETIPDKKTGKWTKDSTITSTEGLEDGEWFFHIVTKDIAGNVGTTASVVKFRIETKPPEVHLAELKKFQGSESFEVEWWGEDKESGVNCFTVEFKEGEKGKWKPWVTEVKTVGATFRGEDGITYYFRIKSRDNAGSWSDYYEDVKIHTTIDVSPPSQVTQIVAKPVQEGRILIEWGKSVDTISGLAYYRIYRSAVSGQLGMQINDDGITTESRFVDESKDLEDGVIYYYTVRPVDNTGNERESGNKQVLAICDRIAMPPVVRSVSHPMQNQWYNNRNVKLSWDTPLDATKISGYYFVFDQTANTVPDSKIGTWIVDNEMDFNNLSDGTWYFHIISKDEAGNASEEATHYQLNIDTSLPKPPVVSSITHQDFNQWYNNNSPSFSWTTPPDPAGIEGYYYVFNQIKDTVPDIVTASWTKGTMASFVDVPDGIWYLHITAKDNASNISVEAAHFQVNVAMTPPPPVVFSSTHQDEDRWYRENTVKLQWKQREYVNEIIGFYYVLDNNEFTVPTAKHNKTMDTNATFTKLNDGVYYFHIVSADKEGMLGKTATHYRIKIKSKVKVKGMITQSNGIMPLANTTVEIMKEDGTTLGVTISDKDGNYEIDNLPVGKVKIKVSVKNLPPQMIYDVHLKEDEPETTLNISSEIFAMYEPATDKVMFNYYIPEDGLVTIKIYNEAGKTLETIEEKKKGKIYNSSYWDTAKVENGTYLFQVLAKGDETSKITKYAIRKIKKDKQI